MTGDLQFIIHTPTNKKIARKKPAAHASTCRWYCNIEPECCAFEWSKELKNCHLNRNCEPTSKKRLDFIFCTKGEGNGNLSICSIYILFFPETESSFELRMEKKDGGHDRQKWKLENGLLINKLSGHPVKNTKHNGWGDPTKPEDMPWIWTLDYNSKWLRDAFISNKRHI